ncbi:sulfotransferase family protein [Neptunicella sp. SCSIO 80796]|uniref:sulfotransferase family protein n=1 Tax=Neptunicella plasticusilytica TaxID=3117012 RepID=UPI003A4E623D
MQKAGTTALASFLHQHPDIYVVDGKEAHAFDHPNISVHPNPSAFIQQHYNKRLKAFNNESIICDATPITLYHPAFLKACYRYNPDAKFIVILRDPVERAISHYQMSRREKDEHRCMLVAFILESFRLRKVRKHKSWPFRSAFRTQSYLHRGLYRQQLDYLFQTIPRNQINVMMQSDLKHNHQATLARIFKFLDLPNAAIEPRTVFVTEQNFSHWSDTLAKIYARLFYRLKRETPEQWQKLIMGGM